MYNVILRSVRVKFCHGKAIISMRACSFIYPVYMHMRLIIFSSVAFLAVPHFSTLSHERHDFRKTFTERKMCVSILSATLSKMLLILRRIQRDIVINVHRSSYKVLVILFTF